MTPLETYRCDVCGTTIALYVHAHGNPTCAHTGTPRQAAKAVLMVRVPNAEVA